MKACAHCGGPGILYTRDALCGNCLLKYRARMRELHEEAQKEQIARENAQLRHPSGKGPRQKARHLWIDHTRYERSGEAEHKEECAS